MNTLLTRVSDAKAEDIGDISNLFFLQIFQAVLQDATKERKYVFFPVL